YEISNFAKPGYRSKHNSSYWQGKAYYGFGPSAHSYNGKNIRSWNIANNALYIQSLEQNTIACEQEILTPTQQLNEYIMISLRTIEGIHIPTVQDRFGNDKREQLMNAAQNFISEELLLRDENTLRLPQKGKFLADGIAAGLFF
ncbi:MAG: coproporphyrinogen III oxidase, partial [Rhizobacter sp.]|nr:coproporphyrinogen III oxidase [Ferruginibacter sp.]